MIKAQLRHLTTFIALFVPLPSRVFSYCPVANVEALLSENHANKLHWAQKDLFVQSITSHRLAHFAFGWTINVLGVPIS